MLEWLAIEAEMNDFRNFLRATIEIIFKKLFFEPGLKRKQACEPESSTDKY